MGINKFKVNDFFYFFEPSLIVEDLHNLKWSYGMTGIIVSVDSITNFKINNDIKTSWHYSWFRKCGPVFYHIMKNYGRSKV